MKTDEKFENEYAQLLNLDLIMEFEKNHNPDIDASFPKSIQNAREARNAFAASAIKNFGIKTILNIGGGGERFLEKHLGDGFFAHEVDIVGSYDTKIDLDSINSLPFDDDSFDLCCGFDILEHLENFHLILDEMLRVARKTVLLSLPNSSYEVIPNVLSNKPQKRPDLNRGTYSKFYGLPLYKPVDRHRWWLYFFDIVRFFSWYSWQNDYEIEYWIPRQTITNKFLSMITGKHFWYTFKVPWIWIKIDK